MNILSFLRPFRNMGETFNHTIFYKRVTILIILNLSENSFFNGRHFFSAIRI